MDVVFVVMPFFDVDRPALGVSLLKASVDRLGFSSCVAYLNVDLAESIGYESYHKIAEGLASGSLIGEWFFADTVFGGDIPPEYEYVDKVLSRSVPAEVAIQILAARCHRFEYLARCARALRSDSPRILAFTTVFEQTCASLALAKTIKAEPDPPIVIFGGANCEGEMGHQLLQSAPWIDYVCTGEGDTVFPAFVQGVLERRNSVSIPGILRQGSARELTVPPMVTDLEALPVPDYRDYFSRLGSSALAEHVKPSLAIESSRGCWWGAKQHCTFCGLNGQTMAYRSKSYQRVFDEMSTLVRTHGVRRMSSVDNILDVRYINTLFPKLRDSGLNLELFYEVKANLKFDQLRVLQAGGVSAIQPGIESLSNEVLRIMKKGCTGLQNIQLLRWCRELGITVAWNIIGGFPGESAESYATMTALIPLLTHLPPPVACTQIRLDRFSPLFMRGEAMGLRRIRPKPAYYYVYPFGRRELERLAYFFDFDYADGRHVISYLEPLQRAVSRWWEAQSLSAGQQPLLDAQWVERNELTVTDTRLCATQPIHHFSGLAARLYALCDSVQSAQGIARAHIYGAAEAEIKTILQDFTDRKLMVEMQGHYLGLAIVKNRDVMNSGELQ